MLINSNQNMVNLGPERQYRDKALALHKDNSHSIPYPTVTQKSLLSME